MSRQPFEWAPAVALTLLASSPASAQDTDPDPLLEQRQAVERDVAGELAEIARRYVEQKLPRCAVDIFRDARSFDPTLEEELLATEGKVGSGGAEDDEIREVLWNAFRPFPHALLLFRRTSAKEDASARDPMFGTLLTTREGCARRIMSLAQSYADATRWSEAFALARRAITVEPDSSYARATELMAAYRDSLVDVTAEQRTDFLKRAKKRGRWKKLDKIGLLSPPLADRPATILSTDELPVPLRLQVDVRLDQQPGGGGPVFLAADSENYFGVELNTIGQGYSLYLTRIVDGDRTVIAGAAMSSGAKTPPAVQSYGEPLYHAAKCGLPMRLVVEVEEGLIRVSTLFEEVVKIPLPSDAPRSGSYGLVHVPYDKPKKKRRQKYQVEFSHLLVGQW